MDLDRFNQILETATALHASGMDWLALAEVVKGLAAELDWPEDTEEWDDCLEDVIEADGCSDAVLLSMLPLAGLETGLPWPAVFRAMGKGLSRAEDRYAFLHRLLVGFREGLWSADFMDVCLANLSRAGIHPGSLIMAGYPTLGIVPFGDLLTRAQGRPGLEQLGRGGFDWRLGIDQWELRCEALDCLDGLHTIQPTTVLRGGDGSILDVPRAALGNRMVFGNDLTILGVRRLKSIGRDVTVIGDLHLMGLAGLERLGERIHVEGNLTIVGSPKLVGLPSDLRVGGAISIRDPRADFEWGALIGKRVEDPIRDILEDVEFSVPAPLQCLQYA